MKTILFQPKIFLFKYFGIIFFFGFSLVISYYLLLLGKIVTLDGPSHVYNSNIFKELLLRNNEYYKEFYKLNSFFYPNYSFSIFHLLSFPASKIELLFIHFIYLIFVLIVFFGAKQNINTNFVLITIIPLFTFNYLSGLGFYNFSLSVPIFVLIIFLQELYFRKFNKKLLLLIASFLIIIYYSHGFVYLISILFLFLRLALILNFSTIISKKNCEVLINWALTIAPSVTIFMLYFFLSDKEPTITFIPIKEKLFDLVNFRILQSYNIVEKDYGQFLGLIYFVLFSLSLYKLFNNFNFSNIKSVIISNIWLLYHLILIILYFLSPDQYAGGGYISDRILLLLVITGFLWMAHINLNKKLISALGLIMIVFCSLSLIEKYNVQKELIKRIKPFEACSKIIENNSILLPIAHSDHWLEPHFSNYLGYNKKLYILENYEAKVGYFPIKYAFDRKNSNTCICVPWVWDSMISDFSFCSDPESKFCLNYVLDYGHLPLDASKQRFIDSVKVHSILVYEEDRIKLYKLK